MKKKINKNIFHKCIYGSMGRCIKCGQTDNWTINAIISIQGKLVFFIRNGNTEYFITEEKLKEYCSATREKRMRIKNFNSTNQ